MVMRLPRPASPRALWRDLRAFAAGRNRHHAIAAIMAIAIPIAIVVTFASDFRDANDAPETIIYVKSWRADRSIEETRAANAENTKFREEGEAERRRQFQAIKNKMNKIGL